MAQVRRKDNVYFTTERSSTPWLSPPPAGTPPPTRLARPPTPAEASQPWDQGADGRRGNWKLEIGNCKRQIGGGQAKGGGIWGHFHRSNAPDGEGRTVARGRDGKAALRRAQNYVPPCAHGAMAKQNSPLADQAGHSARTCPSKQLRFAAEVGSAGLQTVGLGSAPRSDYLAGGMGRILMFRNATCPWSPWRAI